ncbi:unnamed protein product [Malus baccata var. baccata]
MTTAPPSLAPSHRTTITHSVLLRRHRRGLSLCTGSCHCSSTSPTRLTSPDLGKPPLHSSLIFSIWDSNSSLHQWEGIRTILVSVIVSALRSSRSERYVVNKGKNKMQFAAYRKQRLEARSKGYKLEGATEHIGQVFKRVKIQLKRAYKIDNRYAALSLCWIFMFRFCCSVDFIVF